jgi:hypothetical protein
LNLNKDDGNKKAYEKFGRVDDNEDNFHNQEAKVKKWFRDYQASRE